MSFFVQISAVAATQNPDSPVTVLWNTGRANFVGGRSPEHILRNYEMYDDFSFVTLWLLVNIIIKQARLL